jgi:hypothetical protein
MVEMRTAYKILVEELERMRSLGKRRCKWEDNIKKYLREIEFGDVDLIYLA